MAWTETNTADDGTKVEEWQWASQGYYVFLVHYRLQSIVHKSGTQNHTSFLYLLNNP